MNITKWKSILDKYESSVYSNSTISFNISINMLRFLDTFTRIYAIIIYLLYFMIVIKKTEFRRLSFSFVHNVNINGFIFVAHYGFYLFSSRPNTSSPFLNEILCRISEITWASSKFLNNYSVLLLAYSRYIAVCKIEFYKRIIKSRINVAALILMLWLFSITIAISSKYVFRTRAGRLLCFDGHSVNNLRSIFYFIFITCVAIMIPNGLVLYLYAKLLHKLKEISKRVRKQARRKIVEKWSNAIEYTRHLPNLRYIEENNSSNRRFMGILDDVLKKHSSELKAKKLSVRSVRSAGAVREHFAEIQNGNNKGFKDSQNDNNQKTQAKQLIILSVIICFTTITFLLLNAGNLLYQLSEGWLFFRLIIRILTLFMQSLVPIISIIFHPIMYKKLKNILKCKNSSTANKIGIQKIAQKI
jgi:hypothetical protein